MRRRFRYGELLSCDIKDSARVSSREGDINFTVGFLKLLSTHPIHVVVWEKFPFKYGIYGSDLREGVHDRGRYATQ